MQNAEYSNRSKPVVLMGICGGIAVYKTVEVASRLVKAGCDVHVVMTEAATRFVTPLTFQAITGRDVITSLFPPANAERHNEIYPHLYPASEADLLVILPATADMLGKIACGYADDLVAGCALGFPEGGRRFVVPAMNTGMWEQAVVQDHIRLLENRDWQRIGPDTGTLACGAQGEGRMSEPGNIADTLLRSLANARQLADKRVLILSGPTREHFDPVRYISNASSGKMGLALAKEALIRGAHVDFVTGPVDYRNLPRGPRVEVHPVTSAQEMLHAATPRYAKADLVIYAAAVADYQPAVRQETKEAKSKEPQSSFEVIPTPDIARTLNKNKRPGQHVIGFALQDEDAETRARAKLQAKQLDGIVLNAPEAMGADAGSYRFLDASAPEQFESWGTLSKTECAARIMDAAARW